MPVHLQEIVALIAVEDVVALGVDEIVALAAVECGVVDRLRKTDRLDDVVALEAVNDIVGVDAAGVIAQQDIGVACAGLNRVAREIDGHVLLLSFEGWIQSPSLPPRHPVFRLEAKVSTGTPDNLSALAFGR